MLIFDTTAFMPSQALSLALRCTGTRRCGAMGDVVTMMADGVRSVAPYIVFAFFAAHFVAMFNWSRLGPIAAIHGAELVIDGGTIRTV